MEVVDAQELQVNGGRRVGSEVQSNHHGVVVAGPEFVRGVVVGHVVVIPAVFQRDGLYGVDVPDVGPGDFFRSRRGSEDVVERTHHATEQVGVFAGAGLKVGVAGARQDADGIFLGVGVEVTDEEDLVRALGSLQVLGECEQRFGLLGAGDIGGTLALVGIVRGGRGTLGLEVVHDCYELLVVGSAHRLEHLCQRFAGTCEGHGVVVDDGLAHGLGSGLLVDERGADHVLIAQRGSVGRSPHVVPNTRSLDVERVNQLGQGIVAVLAELCRVLDLFKGYDVRAGLGDGCYDLGLLALEVLRVGGSAGVAAFLDRNRVALAVGVEDAAAQLVTGGGEVIEHVEGRQFKVSTNVGRTVGPGGGERRRLD
ncbi:hypothetical protein PJL18_00653 [Paenarthrobacter nicotinovorans]|nr:hypothetical protein [Paenarthrobacter nicotinovorans]